MPTLLFITRRKLRRQFPGTGKRLNPRDASASPGVFHIYPFSGGVIIPQDPEVVVGMIRCIRFGSANTWCSSPRDRMVTDTDSLACAGVVMHPLSVWLLIADRQILNGIRKGNNFNNLQGFHFRWISPDFHKRAIVNIERRGFSGIFDKLQT